jgi:hypothetical protein
LIITCSPSYTLEEKGTNDEAKPLEQHDIIRLSDDHSIESLFDYRAMPRTDIAEC